MEQKQKDTVSGYVKLNYDKQMIDGLKDIIYQFYMIKMDSIILTNDEQYSLMNLLYHRLETADISYIDTVLLYTASDNKYSSKSFHEMCDDRGPTITIIHTETNHVFGAFAFKKWPSKDYQRIEDMNVFLFSIRPNLQAFECRKERTNTLSKHDNSVGPIFGDGWDLYIDNTSNGKDCHGASTPVSFALDGKQVFGVDPDATWQYHFTVVDYEVFSVVLFNNFD